MKDQAQKDLSTVQFSGFLKLLFIKLTNYPLIKNFE